MERVLSAIQPTGHLHLGNYLGAIKNWVDMQNEGKYLTIYGVVDLHAMTVPYNPEELQQQTIEMFTDILACGIDAEKSVLFVQSLVPEHTELTWYFNCLTPYGELTRQTQFKDKSGRQTGSDFISSGLLTYPILQAADILIYNANYVPVGQDQKQHLELSRNIALRFNQRFGEYFNVPEHKFTKTPKIQSFADPTKKMSKSLGDKHYLALFEGEKSFRKKIMRAVTDSGETDGGMSRGVENLISLLRASNKNAEANKFAEEAKEGTLMYGYLKKAVADALMEMLEPIGKKREELEKDPGEVIRIIKEGSAKAREIAQATLSEVRRRIGIIS